MATAVNTNPTSSAQGLANGTSPSPSPEEQERLYDQLLHLRDVVLAGKHPQFKLPPSAIEQLKASLIAPSGPVCEDQNGAAVNGQSFATNKQQLSQSSTSAAPFGSLPGLQNITSPTVNGGLPRPTGVATTGVGQLDPIFLQKSDQLVRAETILKRQRLERDLQVQVEQRKLQSSRDKDHGIDAPSRINIDLVLSSAMDRVRHVSGLKAAGSAASSSFDENDYYSSQVQSEWSSEADSTRGSDRATGAFTGDFERLDGSTSKPKRPVIPGSSMPNASRDRPRVHGNEHDNLYGMEDEDDEYTPPDAAAFDSSRPHKGDKSMRQLTPEPQALEGDDSDYEPGEITADSIDVSPRYEPQRQMQPPPPKVPVIRNHLTHIAAPQPNRVSPLTTTQDSNIELELVNGRPEIVQKPSYHAHQVSRVSSASPTGNSGPGPSKRKKQKKRKRDAEPQGRNKRRQKQTEMDMPRSPAQQEPYIKDEPMSPPPSFANVPPAPQYEYPPYQPPQIDLTGSRAAPPPQYPYEPQPQYQHAPPPGPEKVVRAASPAYRPVQRDNQDLRRVASLHQAKRPVSPQRDRYSPVAPYRAASMAYGDPRLQAQGQQPSQSHRQRSPAVSQRYDDAYSSRAASPALMPPPPPPPPQAQPARRVVQDQYGNRYYAADSAPSQPSTVRASAVPESYERAPSRAAYAPPQRTSGYYEPVEDRMAPLPAPARPEQAGGEEEPFEYTDADGYIVRGYRIRPSGRPQQQQPRYSEAPTSPAYQEYRPYDPMPPPSAPQPPRQAPEPTSPTYQPNISRSYSVRPEQSAPQPQQYLRQASVAPIQYAPLRHGSVAPTQYVSQTQPQPAAPASARAASVMPGYEYAGGQQHAQPQPQQPRFVDQFGNPVYPREVREVRQVDDWYRG